jgi:cytochrome c oxidase subunit 1
LTGGVTQIAMAAGVAAIGLLVLFDSATSTPIFTGEGDPWAYERLLAFVLHAAVGTVLLPGIGLVFDLSSDAGRRAVTGRLSSAVAMIFVAALSLTGGGVRFASGGQPVGLSAAQSGLNLLLLVPATVLLFNFLATLHRSALSVSAALLHALNFVLTVSLGGLAGLMLASLATAPHLSGTAFASAHLHYLLAGGSVTALLAGLSWTWKHFHGRPLDPRREFVGVALTFVGIHLSFLPRFVVGTRGIDATVLRFDLEALPLEILSSIGAIVFLSGLVLLGWEMLSSVGATPSESEAESA